MKIKIDTLNPRPIYEQVRDQIVLAIACGELSDGSVLLSVRKLADELDINFHTVSKSYALLENEGYISNDRKRGAVVSSRNLVKESYKKTLSEKISLLGAEASCHQISLEEFIATCIAGYKKATTHKIKEENK